MKIDDFSYELPKELIAQRPASPRDSARLLVYNRQDASITDAVFRDINEYLVPETTLVLNSAKVDKDRLKFENMEVFILETVDDRRVRAMVRPGKKFKLGETRQLADGISAEVKDIDEHGHRTLEFNITHDDPKLDEFRLTPLPPYIAQDESLAEEYQTVYAKQHGSKAAPTAGLHFTPELLNAVRARHPVAEITLNVGLGTFAPIDEQNISDKRLHEETFSISSEATDILNQASHRTAVGTTSARVLESAFNNGFQPIERGSTEIFIQPGDTLKATDSIVTNFHLPSTSLLMLIAAFTGRDELMRIYQHAIEEEYRFYSFGDAMLVV